MKLSVSSETFNEIKTLLAQQGKEINDGAPLQIEKGTAISPPYDFRMVVVRQNCLMAAAEVFKNSANESIDEFLNISKGIYEWVLNGENKAKEPFVEGVSNAVGKGWK